MKQFVFALEGLLKYRRDRRDVFRQLVAQLLAHERNLSELRNTLERRRRKQLTVLRQLLRRGEVDVDRSASRRDFAGRLAQELQAVQRRQQVVADQLAIGRETLVKADQDIQVIEKLQEKRRAEHRDRQNREATRDRDEAWLGSHAREYAQ